MTVRATLAAAALAALAAASPARAVVGGYDGQNVRGIAVRRAAFALENADLTAPSHQFSIGGLHKTASRGFPATFTAEDTTSWPNGALTVFVDGVASGQITVVG
jgi:hypothetical protein